MTTTPAAPAAKRGLPWARSGRTFDVQEYALVGVIVLLLIAGGILEGSSFLSKDNLFNVLRQGSVVGVLAIGMTFVIATAGIDLSVGSLVAATGIAGGWLMEHAGLFGEHAEPRLHARRDPARGGPRRGQRRRGLLRQGRAVHRHAGHAADRARSRVVDQRQDADLALRP